jgi:hypothetical protein
MMSSLRAADSLETIFKGPRPEVAGDMAAPRELAWLIKWAGEEGILDSLEASRWDTAFALQAGEEVREHRRRARGLTGFNWMKWSWQDSLLGWPEKETLTVEREKPRMRQQTD